MLPIFPIIWLLIFLFRRSQGAKGGGGGTSISFRSLVVVVFWFSTWPFLVALVAVPIGAAASWAGLDSGTAAMLGIGLGAAATAAWIRMGPRWLAFCVLRRVPPLARLAYWFAPGALADRRAGFHLALLADLRRPAPKDSVPPAVSAWTVAALAIEADDAGEHARSARLASALGRLTHQSLCPRDARVFACDALAWRAARRGDWDELARRVRHARGRGAWLAEALARAHRSEGSSLRLLAAWLVAPRRRQRWPLVRTALVATAAPRRPQAARAAVPARAVAGHVALIGDAREGRRPSLEAIAHLARVWDARLSPEHQERFLARGHELGARDPEGAWSSLRDTLVGELVALAGEAEGQLDALAAPGLATELHVRLRGRLHGVLEEDVPGWNRGKPRELGSPPAEFERWLLLRERVERLEAAGGLAELRTAWFGGLRLCAWNWPCHLLDLWHERAAWACAAMFDWAADVAKRVGDEEAATVNRRNVGAARALLR